MELFKLKTTVKAIYDRYPSVEKYEHGDSVQLTNAEEVFYQLAKFIQEPDKYSFNLALLYKNLEDEDLVFGLGVIIQFFENDTYLIKEKGAMLLKDFRRDHEKLYSQSMFATYLANHGYNFTPRKITTYYNRDKLPKPDLKIGNTPYWYESTLEKYMQTLE